MAAFLTGGALAAAAAATAEPPKLVYVSSLAVAGPHTAADPAREVDSPAPINPYGESKHMRGEELLAREGARLRRVVVRPPWVYGPGDRQTLALFRMAARGFYPAVRGGRMEISLVHVDDLVEALLLAGSSPAADGRVYYAADGAVHTVAGSFKLRRAPDAATPGIGLYLETRRLEPALPARE